MTGLTLFEKIYGKPPEKEVEEEHGLRVFPYTAIRPPYATIIDILTVLSESTYPLSFDNISLGLEKRGAHIPRASLYQSLKICVKDWYAWRVRRGFYIITARGKIFLSLSPYLRESFSLYVRKRPPPISVVIMYFLLKKYPQYVGSHDICIVVSPECNVTMHNVQEALHRLVDEGILMHEWNAYALSKKGFNYINEFDKALLRDTHVLSERSRQ